MIDRQFPSDECIIEFLAALYKVQTSDQSSYFVKLKHGYKADSSLEMAELLHANGIEQIIPPIRAVCNCLIVPIIDWSLIVYPFVEGVNGFSDKLTEKQWITLGKALRQVHDFSVPPDILEDLRQEAYSPKWRQAVRSFMANIQDKPANNDAIAQKFLNFIKEHESIIARLVDRAEQLSVIIKDQHVKFVLCHSDIHAGNVLIQENDAIYIVDWDEPIMAPKERDLMFIGGGVGNVWNDPQEEVLFYKGYGTTDINREILAYYRYERIVQDIGEYAQAFLLPNSANTHNDRPEMYKQFISMFDPQGVVDMGFKTDTVNQKATHEQTNSH